MSRKTKITALPALPANIDPSLKPILNAIKEALEVQVGHRGEQLDKAVTFRDLTDSGIATIHFDTVGGGNLLPVTNPGDQTNPPVPHTLAANGTFTNVLLSWQGGFRHPLVAATEVFRSATDDLSTALHMGSTSAHIYVDTVEPGSTFYYWVRFRSPTGVPSVYNSTDGTSATTNKKVSDLIADLSDELNQSHLSNVLSTKIDLIDGHTTAIETQSGVIDGISAEQYVKLDVNGNVSGYGIYSGPTGSEFAVNADVFKIANGASKTVPFSVVGGVTYMNSAMIADASIDVAKINNLTLDMAQVTGTLSANQVDAGLITSDMIEADGISANKITIDGNIEFANTQSGVQFGKTSLGDTQAGAFFGRSGGASGFNISSSTSGIYADSAGTVSLNNVRLYTGVPGSALEHGNPGTHVANISALSTSIYIVVVGAGAGACNTGVPSVWGSVAAQPGAAGSSSWIQFCSGLNGSGSVLATYTASGAPATPHVVGPNNATAYGYSGLASSQANSAGAGGAPNVHGAAGYRGGGGGGAGIAGYNYSGNAYVRIHAQAGQTVSQLVAKPANAQSVKMFVGTGGAGGAYYHPASPNGNNPARYTYTGGRGGHGFVTIADPNSGGVEVDLLSIVNRLNAAGI